MRFVHVFQSSGAILASWSFGDATAKRTNKQGERQDYYPKWGQNVRNCVSHGMPCQKWAMNVCDICLNVSVIFVFQPDEFHM